jgi:hypothetical protein
MEKNMITNIFNEQVDVQVSTEEIHFKLDGSNIQLKKSDSGDFRAEIIFLQSGWNSNDYYFSDQSLSEILDLMSDRPKIYLNHDFWGMGRSESDWAATYEKTWKDESSLKGEINFTNNPNTIWLYNEIEKDPKNVQFSIDIQASVSPKDTPEGKVGRNVDKVIAYRSTDIVSYAAAGGEATKILNQEILSRLEKINSIVNSKNEETRDMEIKSAEELRIQYPQFVTTILNEDRKNGADAEKLTKSENQVTELKASELELKDQVSELETKETNLKAQVETLTNEKATLEAERDGLKTKVDEFETAERISAWETEVKAAIEESKIDTKLITDVFLGDLKKKDSIEEVKASIEDRKTLVAGPVIANASSSDNKSDEELVKQSDEELVDLIKG